MAAQFMDWTARKLLLDPPPHPSMSQRDPEGQGLMGGTGVFHWQVSEATFENFLIIFPLLQSVLFQR